MHLHIWDSTVQIATFSGVPRSEALVGPRVRFGRCYIGWGDSVSCGREGVGRRSRIPDRLPLSRNVPPTFTTIYTGVLTPIMPGGILAEMIKGKSGLSGKRIKK